MSDPMSEWLTTNLSNVNKFTIEKCLVHYRELYYLYFEWQKIPLWCEWEHEIVSENLSKWEC